MSKQPADFQQRERALDPQQSFICEAPAGSGKTELLTQRVLNLLAHVDRPEQVLAITFTRKAAGEMRERVYMAIQSGLQAKPEEPHKVKTWQLAQAVLQADQQRHWQLLENPNRLQIKTFDSLCASLANSLPLESSFGAKPQVHDEPEELYRAAARSLLHSLEDDTPWSEGLSVLLAQLDNKYARLEDLLINLLARREEWAPLIDYKEARIKIKAALEANLTHIIQDALQQLKAHIPHHLEKPLVELAGYAAANLHQSNTESAILNCLNIDVDNQQLPGTAVADLPQWLGIRELLTTKSKGDWRAQVNVRCGFPSSQKKAEKRLCDEKKQALKEVISELTSQPNLLDLLNDLDKLPDPHFSEPQWALLNALFVVLPVLVAQLTVAFKDSNSVDFSEISIRAREALGQLESPTELALKLDYQIQHILVDEFQDTSHSQVDLLKKLTAGWTPGDGKTLFCVGDAMQSIYGFRGANVGLFLHCRDHGLPNVPLTPLRLNTNFRSQAGVVDWVNKTFAKAFPSENDITRGAVTYAHSQAFHDATTEQAVQVHGFIDHEDNRDEAQAVLKLIQQTREQTPDKSIAVLVRNRDHAGEIAQQLTLNGLRFRAVDLEPLREQSIIQDLLALTQALLHPADRVAWLAVLRAPWCGLSLLDLEIIANLKPHNSRHLPTLLEQAGIALNNPIESAPLDDQAAGAEQPEQSDLFSPQASNNGLNSPLTQDGQERLQRVLPILTQGCDNRDRKPLRDWVEGIWLALNGPACLTKSSDLSNADKFFQLLERWLYVTDLPSFDHLKQAVQRLFAAPDPLADDKIQIMTIHKSKGLEFDVVILPGLSKQPRQSGAGLLMWHQRLNPQGDTELIMAPITATGQDKHNTQKHMQAEDAKKTYFETCRLLYVACTRAKESLHLFANLKRQEKDNQIKAPDRRSLLHTIWQAVQLQLIQHDNESPQQATATASQAAPLHRLPIHWQRPELAKGTLLDAFIPRYQYSNEDHTALRDFQPATVRHIGTVTHRYLQHMGETGITEWNLEKLKRQRPQMNTMLRSLGVPAGDIEQAADQVSLALDMVLQDPKASEILSDRHAFSANEYPITFNSKAGPKNLVIDRLYTDRRGTTWVIDYKTATPAAEQNLQDFLAQQKANYESQLKLYQLALQQAGFEKVKTALYFPLLPYWLPLDEKLAINAV